MQKKKHLFLSVHIRLYNVHSNIILPLHAGLTREPFT
jgi:hypothetical protein